MKPNALGWLVVVAIAGCGLGGESTQTSSNTNRLTAADGGSSTGPSKCVIACEAEQLALKACKIVPGSICDVELDNLNQCLARVPVPPVPAPDPCEAELLAAKQCQLTSPAASCMAALDQCRIANPLPPIPEPDPCSPPLPPPCTCGGKPCGDACDGSLEAFKTCLKATPGAQCDDLLQKYGACEAGLVSPPPPTPACFFASQGDATTCLDSVSWKLAALAACTAKGTELVALWTDDSCGVDLFRLAKFQCCDKVIPPPPPPAPQACFYDSIGGPAQCATNTDLKIAADAACTLKGTRLVTLWTDDGCGVDQSRYAKFQCCQ